MYVPNEIKVDVKRRDIWFGSRRNAERCAIARAVKRMFPGARVCVSGRIGLVINGSLWSLPVEALQFINRFDNDGKGSPFTFRITPAFNGAA